jgi:predicted Rossmann-fold nucleotide-binding protein
MAMEVGKRDLTTFVVTETMHERKKVMFMNADAIVMLPGGAGRWTSSSRS